MPTYNPESRISVVRWSRAVILRIWGLYMNATNTIFKYFNISLFVVVLQRFELVFREKAYCDVIHHEADGNISIYINTKWYTRTSRSPAKVFETKLVLFPFSRSRNEQDIEKQPLFAHFPSIWITHSDYRNCILHGCKQKCMCSVTNTRSTIHIYSYNVFIYLLKSDAPAHISHNSEWKENKKHCRAKNKTE